ncbi:hypothetical protein [Actinomadura atramentaria]|uniref:hypothetical protein n=1 Tax=Actinomadura atramentaria TaxID=1990 RepID=UPI0003718A75|nr:hypothetical protein [Actinomadura atramentaria]
MHESGVFRAALDGDESRVRALAGPDGFVCVAPDLASVLLVQPDGDEQRATVAVLGRGGTVQALPVPRSFRVTAVERDGGEFVLTAADGRRVRGTPRQFASFTRIVEPALNPSYAEHLADPFLAAHTLPGGRGGHPPVRDAVLGEVAFDPSTGSYEATAGELLIMFDNAGADRVEELLPHVRGLLAAMDEIGPAAVAHLWDWGATGDETAEEKAAFLAEVRPTSLVVYRSGDFELHFEKVPDGAFLDGYWPVVLHRADGRPVDVFVDA